jgi:hypothetical protein
MLRDSHLKGCAGSARVQAAVGAPNDIEIRAVRHFNGPSSFETAATQPPQDEKSDWTVKNGLYHLILRDAAKRPLLRMRFPSGIISPE